MSELLLELFSEEIPARMQPRAADDLKRLVTDGLAAQGLGVGDAQAFATPRRLALVVTGIPAKSPGVSEERRGPRVGAPDAAVQGFLKAAGLTSLGEATVVADPKKGEHYVARIEKPGRKAAQVIAEVVPDVMRRFPWPKSMRWGTGDFRWVRPLHAILCLFDGRVVPFAIAGLESGATTRGHRFHGPEPFSVESFADYRRRLHARKVVLDAAERTASIAAAAQALAKAHKLTLIEDPALLAENAGLTEWPQVLIGQFDEGFLDVPAECLITAMRTHQKCFSLKHPRTGKLANRFLLVSNLEPKDGGAAIVAGNEKVIRARLADAKFFWEQDLKRPLDEMRSALRGITFQADLGTQFERSERLAAWVDDLHGHCDADQQMARRAAQLAKADLVSGMVGEFPELQGIMGRRYAERAGAKPEIARAIELHYKPKGPSDAVPKEDEGDAVAMAVALADKLDTLVGFWAIGHKPSGSGDPYQLRRAALGLIRIALENDLRLPLKGLLRGGLQLYRNQRGQNFGSGFSEDDLLAFFADRLKVHLREKGARHDLIDAVFALPGQDDLALIVRRVEALGAFLETDDGASLLAGVRRAQSILAIEEKKDKRSYAGESNPELLAAREELALDAVIQKIKADTVAAINVENFAGAMRALAELRAPVDAFFDKVTVNVAEPRLRENRLRLLSELRATTLNVADFSRIAG